MVSARRWSRKSAVGQVLIVAGALACIMVMLREEPRPVALFDADDQAFFDSSDKVASDGDRNMRRAGDNMKKGELESALAFAKHAASEYGQSLSEGRLDAAEKVQKQIKAAIAAKKVANHAMIQGVLAEAHKVKAEAEAEAKAANRKGPPHQANGAPQAQKLSAAPQLVSTGSAEHDAHDFNLANQAHLLYKDEKLLNVRAQSQLAALVKTAQAKLAELKKQYLEETQPDPADDPTQPVPKVLDCGPLSNDCNTNQGGEFYSKHKKTKPSVKAPTVKPVSAHPPAAAAKKSAAKARMAKLALLKRVSKEHAEQRRKELDKRGSYSGAMQLLRDLSTGFLVPRAHTNGRASSPGASQALHEETDHCDSCFASSWKPEASLECAEKLCAQQSEDATMSLARLSEDKAITSRLATAMSRLDHEQLELNNQRATLFEQYLPAAGNTQVRVKRYLKEWVPHGGKAVGSWLEVNNGGGSTRKIGGGDEHEATGEVVLSADECREDGAGPEGLTLEQALDPLNAQQKTLNEQRQTLVQAFARAGKPQFGDKKEYFRTEEVTMGWKTRGEVKEEEEEEEAVKAHAVSEARKKSVSKVKNVMAEEKKSADSTAKTSPSALAPHAHAVPMKEEREAKAETGRAAVQAVPSWLKQGVPADEKLPAVKTQHEPHFAQVKPQPAASSSPLPPPAAKLTAASKDKVGGEDKASVALPGKDKVAVTADKAPTHPAQTAAVKPAAKQTEQAAHGKEEKGQVATGGVTAGAGHHGMPQYDAKAAVADMSSWFDGLIHKQVAVGHGVQRHAWEVKAAPAPAMSRRDKMRRAEDDMIEHHDEAARTGSSLEKEEEQAKQGRLVATVGNELQAKSDTEARDEIQSYFDNLGSK